MEALDFFKALLGFVTLVAVTPIWLYFALERPSTSTLPIEAQVLLGLSLPLTGLLFLGSWIQPR